MRTAFPIVALLLATSACQGDPAPQDNATTNEAAATAAPVPPATPQAPSPATPPSPGTAPDRSSPPPPHLDPDAPTPPAEASPLGAARRLQEYCDAVATERYADAYAYWNDGGRATGMSLAQFRDSFAKYAAYDCHIGPPGQPEGAAGSVYVTIPLQVTGALKSGGGFLLEGPVTMRRVNDVDGSTAEQRRWHISTSGLKPRR